MLVSGSPEEKKCHFEALKRKSVLDSWKECMNECSDSGSDSDGERQVYDGIEYLRNDFGEENFDWGDFHRDTLTVKQFWILLKMRDQHKETK